MGNLKFLNNFLLILLFIGCAPSELKLELQLENQPIGQVFSIADYCEEKYDSIYLIHPYDDEDEIWSLPYKMSRRLRDKCSYTTNDSYVRILFIDNGTVKAYSEIGCLDAYFSTKELIENGPKYHFNQKFILDSERDVYLYNE